MTRIKISVGLSNKTLTGSVYDRESFDIDTEDVTSSIKAEVHEAFKQIEKKLKDELGKGYGDKQSKLDDFQ